MHFMIYCLDKPGHTQVRAENRPAHLEYLKRHSDQLIVAGPVLTDDGEGVIGSLLLMDFPSRDAADAFSAGDPYYQAGLFGSVTVRPFRKTLPES